MNKKNWVFLSSLSLLLVSLLSGCGSRGNASSSPATVSSSSGSVIPEGTHIFSEPATRKVRLSESFSSYEEPNLSLSLCQNEKEGVQLIFSPEETCYYDVSVSPLSNGTATIPSDHITLYREHYLDVTNTFEPNPILGYYPDPLVPLALSKEHRENIVSKGQNQAILIEVKTETDTPEGDYAAEVTLTLGEAKYTYPLSVHVEGIALPKTPSARRAFALWESEYSAAYQTTIGSEEYMKKAYELLASYDIAPTNLPGISKLSLNEQIDEMATYAAREDIACFSLPYVSRSYSVVGHGSYVTADFSILETLLRGLIARSSASQNILAKCYLYVTTLDEQKPANYWKVIDSNARFYDLKQTLAADSTLWEGKAAVKQALLSLENVVTLTQNDSLYSQEPAAGLYSACPLYQLLDNVDYLTTMKKRMAAGNSYWWYGCNNPVSPYPTYHIDDDLLAAREVSWMQKNFGIQGELYWCSNINSSFESLHNVYVARDCWKQASTSNGSGDGWLIYPGNRYDSKESFPSLRLMAIRDGIEDYALLSILEQSFLAAKATYGLDEDFAHFMAPIYSLIINGVRHKDDDRAYQAARQEVITQIKALKSPQNALIITHKNPKTNFSSVSIYAAKDSSIQVNGVALNGTEIKGGMLYQTEVKSVAQSYATVQLNDSLLLQSRVGGYANIRYSFDDSLEGVTAYPYQKQGISIQKNDDDAYAISGSSLALSLSYVDRLSYRPSVGLTLAPSETGFDAREDAYLGMEIYNASSEEVALTIRLSDILGTSESLAYISLAPGQWNELTILLLPEALNFAQLSELRLLFNNSATNRVLYLDDVAFYQGGIRG